MNIIIPTLFFFSAILAIANRKTGYFALVITSIFMAAVAVFSFNILHLFWLITSVSWAMISIYSISYDRYGRWLSPLFAIMLAGMSLVLTSGNYLIFLSGWEIMSISAYFILGIHREKSFPSFIFMAFSELSTIFILLGFALAYSQTGSIAFTRLTSTLPLDLTVIGFLLKMGAFPFLLVEWLPIAHSSAPANVSAALSGTMPLMGVYGIIKMSMLSPIDPDLGLLLISVGAFTAFFGALYSHASDHYKMLPAYSSVESYGSILLLLGVSLFAPNNIIALFSVIGVALFSLAHSFAKSGIFMISGLVKSEYMSSSTGISSRQVDVGRLLFASSLSGLLPNIGGVATWMLLEIMFMSAFVERNSLFGLLFLFVGTIMAMTEGLITAVMIKFIAFSGVFSSSEKKGNFSIFIMGLIVLFSGMIASIIVNALDSIFTSSAPNLFTYFIIISLKGSGSTFGGISPLYVGLFIGLFTLLTYFAFGKNKLRRVPVWNNGEALQEKYAPSAFSNNLKLILKSLYRPNEYTFARNIFWDSLVKFTLTCKRIAKYISYYVMNSQINIYIIYLIIMFLFIMIYISRF